MTDNDYFGDREVARKTVNHDDLIRRLRARIFKRLPRDWQKGLKCPECGVGADRPKCAFEMGGSCPRHDPNNYEPSPYVSEPDKDCIEAADALASETRSGEDGK